jgi:hypothetical protein
MTALIRSLPFCVLAIACTDPTSPDEATFDRSNAADPVGEAAPVDVVATLETEDGARVTFIDVGDGVAVEITNSLTTPATDRVLAQDPSALELYLAISPTAKPPRALVDAHIASGGGEPRQLRISMGTGEASGYYDCDDVSQWESDFDAWAPDLDGEYFSPSWHTGATTGYVGYAPNFYFDVCRPTTIVSATSNAHVIAQRRSSSGAAWQTISTQGDTALDLQQRRWRFRMTSNVCTSFQYQLYATTGSHRHRRAARWSDEWSCSIGL